MPGEAFDKDTDLKHTLNANDEIYTFIQDDHIDKSVKKLTKRLKEIKAIDETNLETLPPEKMKEFVELLPKHKLNRRNIEIHFNATDYVFKKQVKIRLIT